VGGVSAMNLKENLLNFKDQLEHCGEVLRSDDSTLSVGRICFG